MAKDGTARGGARPGSGPKRKALTEKITVGKEKPTILDFQDVADIHGEDMPPVKDYLKAKQKNGIAMCAEDVYKETWQWLKARGCEKIVNPQLIEQYAMSVSRWIQCETAISETGFLAKHPTTGNAIQSPYVAMCQSFMKQANQSWFQIFQLVRENSTSEYQGMNPQDDVMERLLRARKGN